jgi:dipeptidase D
MTSAITGLQPKRFWEYFAELSEIPRCSKNEEKAAAYVSGVAKDLGLHVEQDPAGNVVVRKPASPGREDSPAITLQSHLDMVCEKNSGTVHDFSRDPLVLKRSGNFISADGTTLGGDNGVGVCTSLFLMEDKTLLHGPLEFLFTVDEETGLTGAVNLSPGILKARTLINLDSEDEGVIYVGCAGGGDTIGTLPAAWDPMPAGHSLVRVKTAGLRGGHSGIEIHAGRGNAIKLLNRALYLLFGFGMRLCSIEGGNKRNAIPREAEALCAVPAASLDRTIKAIEDLEDVFKSEFASVDPGISLSARVLKGKKTTRPKVLKKPVQKRCINLLSALPHGVIAMSPEIPGLVRTSTNLAKITTSKKSIVIETSQRSSVASEKTETIQMAHALFDLAGATIEHGDGYPGWKANLSSPLLRTAQKVYFSLFNTPPQVKAVHAGLECGIIGEKYPEMDMISIGPTLEMVHSPEERVHIDSVKKYLDFLVKILASL